MTKGSRASKGKSCGTGSPLPSPSTDAKASKIKDAAPLAGRVFLLHQKAVSKGARQTWREIKELRDKAFKSHQDAKKKASRIRGGKKGNEPKAKTGQDGDRAAARHCFISPRHPRVPMLPKRTRLVAFKRGALVLGRTNPNAIPGKRGEVSSFSNASRLRCAWSFLNAETEWLAMVTLTYPVDPNPERCREQMRDWMARVNRAFPGMIDYGWVIEGTKQERPHFHIFFGEGGTLGKAIEQERCSLVRRRGRDYEIMRGRVERVCVEAWLAILERDDLIGDEAKTKAFQWGGICERLRSKDAAARYVSKEASKRTQKGDSVNLGKGCYWRLARHLKPKARFVSDVTAAGRKTLPSFSRIYDRSAVEEFMACEDFEQVECDEKSVREMVSRRYREAVSSRKADIQRDPWRKTEWK